MFFLTSKHAVMVRPKLKAILISNLRMSRIVANDSLYLDLNLIGTAKIWLLPVYMHILLDINFSLY